jgi:hypothetical protein
MWRDLFSDSPLTVLALAALLFFVAVFAAVLVWTGSRRRSTHYRAMARLPIDFDEHVQS